MVGVLCFVLICGKLYMFSKTEKTNRESPKTPLINKRVYHVIKLITIILFNIKKITILNK